MNELLAQLGENELVRELTNLLPPAAHELLIGPGDDCAVAAMDKTWDLLLKTDVVVEGVHFLPDEQPERIGHKALARAISDIAAMGGIPEHALVTLLAAPGQTVDKIKKIYQGLLNCAEKYNVQIAGGETSSLPGNGLIINIAMTGRVEHGGALLRSTAREGDLIMVTGVLGGSLSGHHLDFMPRVREGRLLRSLPYVHAMMDLSDGLAKDLPRLADCSRTNFEVFEDSLPLRPGCTREQALGDGEDYELLFTIDPTQREPLHALFATNFPDTPLTCIGKVLPQDIPSSSLPGGWEHFQ